MSHCDPTTLALVALGEEIPGDEAAHLSGCEQCTADAAELAHVVTLGREAPAELPPVPDHVWAGIQRELALTHAPDGEGGTVSVLPARPAGDPEPGAGGGAEVVDLATRRRGGLLGLATVAAVAGAVVGGGVVWAAVERGSVAPEAPPATFVAQAVLAPLSDAVAEPGQADVIDSPDGRVVRVDARALPENAGFYEVWLLDAGATKLVALGALPAGAIGTFTLPPGLSLRDFPVVDISLEDYDGDPTHSTNSLMRGMLET